MKFVAIQAIVFSASAIQLSHNDEFRPPAGAVLFHNYDHDQSWTVPQNQKMWETRWW